MKSIARRPHSVRIHIATSWLKTAVLSVFFDENVSARLGSTLQRFCLLLLSNRKVYKAKRFNRCCKRGVWRRLCETLGVRWRGLGTFVIEPADRSRINTRPVQKVKRASE
jgi:hypothetical protein